MDHELSHDVAAGMLVLKVVGTVTMNRIREIAPQVARLSKESECRKLLNDMSEATIDIPLTGLYQSPQAMDESGVGRTIKRALVLPSEFHDAEFLENVSQNRGHNLRVFDNVDEARQWLGEA